MLSFWFEQLHMFVNIFLQYNFSRITLKYRIPVLPLVHLSGGSLQVIYLLTGFQPDVLQLLSQLGLVL